VITFVRSIGVIIVALLALASALTVANVVRLAAHARRDEIEIMQLVGAPLAYVRGPLVLEGVMQGGAGAIVAILALGVLFAVARARYGTAVAEAVGLGAITFLPVELWIILLLGGMLLGSVGGLIVARSVR
jgi:cell division transport system permease protein